MKRVRETLQRELATRAKNVDALAHELVNRGHELRARTDAMRVALELAEEASAQKTKFMRLVTHELFTPLTAIELGLQLAASDPTPLPARQLDRLRRCAASADRLHGLIGSLLEHARFESGQARREVAETDVNSIAAELVDELRPLAEAKHLALRVRTGHLSRFASDARLVRLILSNLLGNALKFTLTGEIVVSVDAAGAGCQISVRDTGPGILPSDHERIFEPFAQLQDLARKHLPGIGLGLSLVKELVQTLEGDIQLQSEPGHGTTFTIFLPSLGKPTEEHPRAR